MEKPTGVFRAADRGGYSPVSGDARLGVFYRPTGVHQLSCLAKEVPDFWRIPILSSDSAGKGLVARTSTHASWSDPTLSARCDGSQLLLGSALHEEGSPIGDYPRHHHQSCVWRFWLRRMLVPGCGTHPGTGIGNTSKAV
jgi:hypothetical protein